MIWQGVCRQIFIPLKKSSNSKKNVCFAVNGSVSAELIKSQTKVTISQLFYLMNL